MKDSLQERPILQPHPEPKNTGLYYSHTAHKVIYLMLKKSHLG